MLFHFLRVFYLKHRWMLLAPASLSGHIPSACSLEQRFSPPEFLLQQVVGGESEACVCNGFPATGDGFGSPCSSLSNQRVMLSSWPRLGLEHPLQPCLLRPFRGPAVSSYATCSGKPSCVPSCIPHGLGTPCLCVCCYFLFAHLFPTSNHC